jgi:hypothetical protein
MARANEVERTSRRKIPSDLRHLLRTTIRAKVRARTVARAKERKRKILLFALRKRQGQRKGKG